MKRNCFWMIEVQSGKYAPFFPTYAIGKTKADANSLRKIEWMPKRYAFIFSSRVTKYEAVTVRK